VKGHRPLRAALACCAALGFVPACSAGPLDAVRDLAAIHTEDTWRPRSPAQLSAPPEWYLDGPSSLTLPREGLYEVSDHHGLEVAILNRVGAVDPEDPPVAFEACSWLMLELLHDDHPLARVKAAVLLSDLAGAWITAGARLPAQPLDGDLAQALRAVENARDPAEFTAALRALENAPLPDGTATIRLIAGLGRHAYRLGIGAQHSAAPHLAAIGTRALIHALALGAQDPDPAVAQACRARHDLLARHASAR
jgi:hypothetical protein